MVSKLMISVLAVLSLTRIAAAAEYPCPSDPGFCYRDIGNDGCFDSGVDEGPINDEIEASNEFPVVPLPGSIVCPPSVAELTASDEDMFLETQAGSSILFYGTKITADDRFQTISGASTLLGGPIFAGVNTHTHYAENDIALEGRVKLNTGATASDLVLESQNGNITVGPKVAIKASEVQLLARSGDITLLDKVVLQMKNAAKVFVVADGTIEMTNAKVKNNQLVLIGNDVLIQEKASFKSGFITIAATDDIVIDRVTIKAGATGFIAPITLNGTNVTIGVGENGRVPRSRVIYRGDQVVAIDASDTIKIDNLVIKSNMNVEVEAMGTTADVTNSQLVGIKNTPLFEVSAGPGSTCDLTGTVVKKATLVTSCDTVVGP